MQQGKILGFLNNTEDAGTISGLVEDIRDAILDYQAFTIGLVLFPLSYMFSFQTSIQQDIHDKSFLLIVSFPIIILSLSHYHTGVMYVLNLLREL